MSDSMHGSLNLRFRHSARRTNHSHQERGYTSARNPLKIVLDLLGISCVKIIATPTMSMDLNKARSNQHIADINATRSKLIVMADGLNMGITDGDRCIDVILAGIKQVGTM